MSDYERGHDESYEKFFLEGKADGEKDRLNKSYSRLSNLSSVPEDKPSNDHDRGYLDGKKEGYAEGYSKGYGKG